MRIFIIGGKGVIGRKASERLQKQHDIIIGGRTHAEVDIDITNNSSMRSALETTGKVDAIVCIAGEAKWAPLEDMSEEDYYIGLRSKLMGQVNLVRMGSAYVHAGGSITLSTGILADRPVPQTTSAAMVNGAIHSFVKAVDLEIKNGIRVNAVSLGVVEDAYEKYKNYFPGHRPVSMDSAVNAYAKSVEGRVRGEIIRVYA